MEGMKMAQRDGNATNNLTGVSQSALDGIEMGCVEGYRGHYHHERFAVGDWDCWKPKMIVSARASHIWIIQQVARDFKWNSCVNGHANIIIQTVNAVWNSTN